MKALKGVASGAVLALVMMVPTVQAADGAALYQQHCARCHADDGKAKNWRGMLVFAKNLANERWQSRVSDVEIMEAIRRGPGMMPGFADKFSEEELMAVTEKVRSFRDSTIPQ